jgi:hypothetical protein
MLKPRKLILLDPEQKLLKDFQATTNEVIAEAKEVLDSVPTLPKDGVDTLVAEEEAGTLLLSAEELLDCMAIIQQQLKELKKTYGYMKKYIENVCISTHTNNIESKTAIGFLCTRTQFDQKIFREQNPDKYQEYIKQTAPFLVVKSRK